MTSEELIQTQREIALQHFPGDKVEERAARSAYQVGLLETKIRELMHRPILDLPVFDPFKPKKQPSMLSFEEYQELASKAKEVVQ